MELTVRATSTNQDNESSVSLLKSVATTATATAILLTSSALGAHPAVRNLKLLRGEESVFGQYKDYEKTLIGFESSGFESGFSQDDSGVAAILGFAQRILDQMSDIPAEYDEIFQKNFRDLLA